VALQSHLESETKTIVLIKGLCHARLGDFSTDLMVISNIELATHIIAVNQPKRDTEKPRKVMHGKAQLEIILHYSKLKKVYHKDEIWYLPVKKPIL